MLNSILFVKSDIVFYLFVDFFEVICIIETEVTKMHEDIISSIKIHDILSVVKINSKQGTQGGNKNREISAFAYKTEGKTIYTQDGVNTISDAGHIVFLPKGASYTYVIEQAGECILFELDFGDDIPFDKITSFHVKSSPEILSSAQKADRFWTYKKQGFRNKCMSCIYSILSYVTTETEYLNSEKYDIIKTSVKYIEERLDDPDIDTEFLASLSGISVPYFRKIFIGIYKMPVAKYIESIRIGKARDLLKNDFGTVGDVAECVGYRNIYHFSKAFKKVTGMSPTEFSRGRI